MICEIKIQKCKNNINLCNAEFLILSIIVQKMQYVLQIMQCGVTLSMIEGNAFRHIKREILLIRKNETA